jgi:hypothetical protein
MSVRLIMGDIIRLPHSYGGEASESAVRATLSRMRIDRLRAFEQMCQLKAELSEPVGGAAYGVLPRMEACLALAWHLGRDGEPNAYRMVLKDETGATEASAQTVALGGKADMPQTSRNRRS